MPVQEKSCHRILSKMCHENTKTHGQLEKKKLHTEFTSILSILEVAVSYQQFKQLEWYHSTSYTYKNKECALPCSSLILGLAFWITYAMHKRQINVFDIVCKSFVKKK